MSKAEKAVKTSKEIKENTPKGSYTIRYFTRAMRHYKKGFYPLYILLILTMVGLPLIKMFGPKMLIDEIMGNAGIATIIRIASVMILLDFLLNTLSCFIGITLEKDYYEGLNRHLEAGVGKKSMELRYETTENKSTLDELADARTGIDSGYSGGVKGLFTAMALLIGSIAVMLLSAVTVVRYTVIPLLLVAINVTINAFFESKLNKLKMEQIQRLAITDRAYYYLVHGLSDIRYGKDIRLFDAKNMMLDRVDEFNDEQSKINKMHAGKSLKYVIGSKINLAVTAALTYLLFALMVINGDIGIGDFTMLSTAVTVIVTSLNTVMKQILDLKKFCGYSGKYIRYVEGNTYVEKGDQNPDLFSGFIIEFRDVSFRYPGAKDYALKNINAVIRSGEHWSVVGLNGAGKSTFIKLLCRLYECTGGEILINGVNILDYDYEQYMKILSVVFQDFCLLNFSIKENLICDRPETVSDEDLIPLLQRVGLKDKVDSLPMGLSTPVFRYYDQRGFEPSGGEQQKIAMARALYKDAPVLILDEPTAALDPIAEKEIYEQFHSMVESKTAVFISHRLASCKFCDKILVFDDGKIVERGTHSELLDREDGLYSRMFKTQQKMYL